MGKYFIIAFISLAVCQSATSQTKEMALVWQDEFDGSELDLTKWTSIEGDGCPELCGFGNNELQYYTSDNLSVEDGNLILETRKESRGNQEYTSVKLVTQGKGDWQYGRVDVRAKLPYGRGTWAAIWMLPSLERAMNWPDDGEIDIMEHVGYNQGTIYGTIHTAKYNHKIGTQKNDSLYLEDAHTAFHNYSVVWDEKQMTWSIDGEEYFTLEKGNDTKEGWPFDQRFHLILNVAVGGDWGGLKGVADDIWPQQMVVDYVRIYQ